MGTLKKFSIGIRFVAFSMEQDTKVARTKQINKF
jgi:hypothetical protein